MANSVDSGKNNGFGRDHSTTDMLHRLNSQFDAEKNAAEKRRADNLGKNSSSVDEGGEND